MASVSIRNSLWLNNTNLKALYEFNAGALTVDASRNAHTLTAIGTPAENTSGQFLGCVLLDGATEAYSAVDHADFKPTGNFTVGGWIKCTGVNGGYIFQSFSSAAANSYKDAGWKLLVSGAKAYFLSAKNTGGTTGTDRQVITGGTDVNNGAWHQVVATWDGSYLRLYVDGASDAEAVAWANAPAYYSTNYVRVGCRNEDNTNGIFFGGAATGYLDDVFLLNGTALDAGQVNLLYAASSIKKLNGLRIFNSELRETAWALHTNCKAYYRFENGALDQDETANNHDLSAISVPVENTSGKFGSAITFAGDDAYSITDHTDFKPATNFSIGAWVKSTGVSVQYIFSTLKLSTNFYGFGLRLTDDAPAGQPFFYLADGAGHQTAVTAGVSVTDDAWHFIVATFDGTNGRLYTDGKFMNSSGFAYNVGYTGTHNVRIGCVNLAGTNASFFVGSLDDVFFLNGTVLSAAEIIAIYNGSIKSINGLAIENVRKFNGLQ